MSRAIIAKSVVALGLLAASFALPAPAYSDRPEGCGQVCSSNAECSRGCPFCVPCDCVTFPCDCSPGICLTF